MTLLEVMIVIAIIGFGALLVHRGFRSITRADLVENTTELAQVMKRASAMSIEKGEMHRVLIDLDKQLFVVETCLGSTSIMRNEAVRTDPEALKKAMEKGQQKLRDMPTDAFAAGDPEEATRRATAIAGSHIADRECSPVKDGMSGDVTGKGFQRALRADKGIKFKRVFVQHMERDVEKGQVAVYFFPQGQAEKAIVEVTDGEEVFTVLVYGLTGRVELTDGALRDPDDHMLKNVMGDKDLKQREGSGF
jgi:general secretion pathway protein H